MPDQLNARRRTRMVSKSLPFFSALVWALTTGTLVPAAEPPQPPPPTNLTPTSMTVAASAATPTAPAAEPSLKEWVWLDKQSLYGFGYQRPDGLWVIDPGSKRSWVWLAKQGVFGFGYRRDDGFWVIDPGSKRSPAPAATETATPAAAPTGDPYGFVGWLNATRASFGLPAVGVDPELSNWAAANNAQQAARGLGHFVMGPASRQNSAAGASAASVGPMWMNSPAHRAALLDPTIRWIGIASMGAYWTYNAR